MPAAFSRDALDRAVAVLAGAAVVAFAAGSSSVEDVKELAQYGRWLVLAALMAAAAPYARDLPRLPRLVPAAAGAFAGLALLSSLWSVDPRLTVARALSLTVVLSTAVLVAAGARASHTTADRVVRGLLVGAVVVTLLGVVVAVASYGTAVEEASIEAPPRYRGFGENANTVALLLALALPLALAEGVRSRGRARVLAAAAVVLFAGSIAGSGSRGALLGAAVGCVVVLAIIVRGAGRLALACGAAAAAFAVVAVLQSLPQPSEAAPAASPPPGTGVVRDARYVDVERVYPLDNDVGRPLPGGGEPPVERELLGTSGRGAAWRGALDRIADRPLLGFGFGTEARAFVDRYYAFVGGVPESSYLGIALQLGLVGLLGFGAVVAILVAAGARAIRRRSTTAAACAGVVAAGLSLAIVQSYVYSAGNIAAATFWLAAFLLPASAPEDAL